MKKKRMLIVLIATLLIGGGAVVAAGQSQTASTAQVAETGEVTLATLSSVVESSGSVSPETSLTLSFGASGVVSKVNVTVGDRVQAGRGAEADRGAAL